MAPHGDLERTGWRARALRMVVTAGHHVRRLIWQVSRTHTHGVRGIPVTPDGRIVLIRHTYLPGWHFPGGRCEANESPQAAAERELREEIGMTSRGRMELLSVHEHRRGGWRDTITVFVAHDVEYAPRLSVEVAAIAAFAPDELPADLSPATRRRIEEWREGRTFDAEW